jgi:Sap-like sulfolipid-1-addressing protein
MPFEVLVLAAISAIRPATSQAAVVALLRTPTAVRALTAFTLAGLIASAATGIVVVLAFQGAGSAVGHSTFAALFSLLAGVAAIGFAAGVRRGKVPSRRERPRGRMGDALAVRLREPSAATAAAAGAVTHIPGLIYLAALNLIAADQPGATSAAFQVTVYNVVWFAVPLAALVIAVRSPDTARRALDDATAFFRRNQETVLVVVFGTVGAWLAVKGLVELL